MRCPARLTVRSNQTAWVAYTQVSRWGRHAHNVSREIPSRGWEDYGEIDWLITSQRIVGRLRASSDMMSVWWSGLAGFEIDLHDDRLTLNGANGWTGQLTCPDVSPIALAAAGMCYGPDAIAVHPALAALRKAEGWQTRMLPRGARTPTEGATILTMPNRRRSS
jgi:hypothetical protein